MSHKVVLIRGDGTGPELCEAVLKVLDASGAKIQWIEAEAGETAPPTRRAHRPR
jgi:isocitrate dehydrogenase (NAD+)